MDKIAKLLAKISKKDLLRIKEAAKMIQSGEITGIKLKGQNHYRYRVGSYRIIYIKKGSKNIVIEVRKRDEGTYKK